MPGPHGPGWGGDTPAGTVPVGGGPQPGEDGQDAPVVAAGGGQAELGEAVGDVGLDGLGAEEELLADAAVGPALGHVP
jgi:hypothetical protein